MLAINSRQFWAVFWTKLGYNLRSEVSRTYLGYLWWLIEPVLFVTTMYIVFAILLRIRTDDFLVFLVCGQVAYSWFARSVSNASNSLVQERNLMNQVPIQKIFFPLLTISQDLVKQVVVLAATFGFLMFMNVEITLPWISLPLVLATQWLFILGAGMVCAGVVPLIPDFRFLIGTLLMLGMWGSGIFYSYKDVLIAKHQDLFLANPMANLIKNYRQVIIDGQWPDVTALTMIALFSLLLIVGMMGVFRRLETTYARLALQ